jgi:propanediol dehydratase small subunit
LARHKPIQQKKKDAVTTYEATSLLSIALQQFKMSTIKKQDMMVCKHVCSMAWFVERTKERHEVIR